MSFTEEVMINAIRIQHSLSCLPLLIDIVNIEQLHYVHFDSAIVVYSEPSISRICSVFRQTIATFPVKLPTFGLEARRIYWVKCDNSQIQKISLNIA